MNKRRQGNNQNTHSIFRPSTEGENEISVSRTPPVRGVIYDMDGTLTRPYIDWRRLRKEMEIPDGILILEHLDALQGNERKCKEDILLAYEKEAAENSELHPGVKETIAEFIALGFLQAIVTNNTRLSAKTVLNKHKVKVDYVVTREDGPPKPAGDLLIIAMENMRCTPEEIVYVGDGMYDIKASRNTGIRFILFASRNDSPEWDVSVNSFKDLIPLITKEGRQIN